MTRALRGGLCLHSSRASAAVGTRARPSHVRLRGSIERAIRVLALREASVSGLIATDLPPAALWFAHPQRGEILRTILLMVPVFPCTCKSGMSCALLDSEFSVSPGSHGAQFPGLVGIGPPSPLLAFLI